MNQALAFQPDARRRRAVARPLRRAATRLVVAVAIAFAVGLGFAAAAGAQPAPPAGASAPPPPAGNGTLVVEVRLDEATEAPTAEALAGLPVLLYALDPEGRPGFASRETDATGRARFEDLSTAPGIVYLVGVRYRDVPFGERITFEPGQTEGRVALRLREPTDNATGIVLREVRTRVDWIGDRIRVREVLRVENPGQRVILLPDDSPDALIERRLPEGATDFGPGATSIGEGLREQDGRVRFRGPLYPGDQRVEYEFSLPVTGRLATFSVETSRATERVVAVAGTTGMVISGAGLEPSSALPSDGNAPLEAWARAGLPAGEPFQLAVALPESRRDAGLLGVPRADLWLEVDDTRLAATSDWTLSLPPGAPLLGSPEAPLLRVTLPAGATLSGIEDGARALGVVPREDGGFDVIGPVPPGQTSLRFGYRMPTGADGVSLAMRFPREVSTVNVLIADTGVAVDSNRLHRRRPFRSGTRNYLHREAYQVMPNEEVTLQLEPLRDRGLPRRASIGLALLGLLAGVAFLFAPLSRIGRSVETAGEAVRPLRAEREAVYSHIRDLDHDHETGKLDEADYRSMREALRARAIELLRLEQAASNSVENRAENAPAGAATIERDATAATGPTCSRCGEQVEASWRFCVVCGGPLAAEAAPDEGAG